MANANQGFRSGNALGRLTDISNEAIYSQGIKLEPGYLIRLRSRMHLVTAVEPMVVDKRSPSESSYPKYPPTALEVVFIIEDLSILTVEHEHR